MTRKEFNLARERRKAGLTQKEMAIITHTPISTTQYRERNGVTDYVMQIGYKKILEENAKK